MKNPFKTAIIVTAALFCAAVVQTSSAATTTVLVGSGGDVFSPDTVSISANDSVIWSWVGSFHSTTSGTNGAHGDDNGVPSGLWDSGVASPTHSFTNTFVSAGTFFYYCSIHYPVGMTGQVLVASATLPPSVTITKPLNGAVFAAPANVTIQAAVSAGSTAVTNVQFLTNNVVVANENSGPFSTTANSLAAGAYTLSVIAQDSGGLSATNSVGISVVTPVTVTLMNDSKLSATDFEFSYSASIGLNYVVERSSDFINWVSLSTNTASSNPVLFDDTNATNGLDFYRVGQLPNP